jgi:1,4-dihydroxy-2-naphthoate octaprenyltransferase
MQAYLGVARARFLLLPVTLVAVGAAAAARDGAFDPIATIGALVGLVALHAAVNALNEYSDFRRGIDLETRRTPFSGGSGTLPGGAPPHIALSVAVIGSTVGAILGAYFLHTIGLQLLPVLVLGILCVLGYTDFLARVYLGEVFAGLGLGTLPVLGAALVQGGELGATAIAASIPPFFMTFNLLLLNEFPDEEADQRGGRRNLITLLGRSGAARVYVLAGWLTKIALLLPILAGIYPWLCLLALLPSAALMPPTRWALSRPDEPVPVQALGANVVWNLATNTVLAFCLAVATAAA